MRIRDWVNRAFTKPTEQPQRRKDDPVNLAAAARAKEERRQATAIDQKQAELMRQHLTPELTPYGTRPKTPLNEEQARRRAEQLVRMAGEQTPVNESAQAKKRYRLKDSTDGQEAAPTLREEAAQRGFAATLHAVQAQRAAKEQALTNENDPGRKWLDGSPTEPEAFKSYREDIETMTAQHDSEAARRAVQPLKDEARHFGLDIDCDEYERRPGGEQFSGEINNKSGAALYYYWSVIRLDEATAACIEGTKISGLYVNDDSNDKRVMRFEDGQWLDPPQGNMACVIRDRLIGEYGECREAARAEPAARSYSPDDDAAEVSAEHDAEAARRQAQTHEQGAGRELGR